MPRYVRVRVEDKNNDEKVDGSVPLSALGSRRAVLDIATRSLLVESRDADGELASSLSAILGVAVALKGDALILGVARDPGFAEALKPFIDSPVTSIDGKAGAEIAKELRRGGAATLKIMSEMQRARAAGYTMLIETRFGPRQLLMPKG